METITVKSTATNSELLKLVQSLTIDKVDFDNLTDREASSVTHATDRAFSELVSTVSSVRYKVENNYPKIDRMLETGVYDFTLNLNFAGGLKFGQYQIKMIK